MIAWLGWRLVSFVATLLVASLVVFLVMEVLPGDPASVMLGMGARPESLAALRAQMGLDEPLLQRYVFWVARLLVGDFGRSYTYSVPVAELIGQRVLISAPLAILAIGLSTLLAIPLGVHAASRRGRAGDVAVMGVAQIGVSVPNFWLGLLLILCFAVWLPWLPAGGFAGWDKGVWPGLRSLILPAVALALPQAAILARVTRSSVLDVLRADYVRTALAKGVSPRRALWRHAVPNALIPVVTIIGLQFSFLLAGTIIIENVFSLPGLGRLIFQAIAQRDLIVVEDMVVLLAGSVILVNLLVDLVYAVIDPRLAQGEAR